MISALDELAHAVLTFSPEEAERALDLLRRAGLMGPGPDGDQDDVADPDRLVAYAPEARP
jgi:hypothetical protein